MSEHEKDDSESGSEQMGAMSWAKKIMTVGVGTFFLTEEALKTLVSEFKLPKEVVSSILSGAKGVRKEFMQNVVHEAMSRISEKVDPAQVVSEILKRNEITLEIKIKAKPRAQSLSGEDQDDKDLV
jgi:hypothetical protein